MTEANGVGKERLIKSKRFRNDCDNISESLKDYFLDLYTLLCILFLSRINDDEIQLKGNEVMIQQLQSVNVTMQTKDMFLYGIVSPLFEGSMYTFIFSQASSFMVCCLIEAYVLMNTV